MTALLAILLLFPAISYASPTETQGSAEWRVVFYHRSATPEGQKKAISVVFPLICYRKSVDQVSTGNACDQLNSGAELFGAEVSDSVRLLTKRKLVKNVLAMRLNLDSAFETNLTGGRGNGIVASYPEFKLESVQYKRTAEAVSSKDSVKITDAEEREVTKRLKALVANKKPYETSIMKYQERINRDGKVDTLFIATAGTDFDPENPSHPALGLLSAVFIASRENPTALTLLTKFTGEVAEIINTFDLRGDGSKFFLLEHFSEHGGYLSFAEIKDSKWVTWLDHLPN